MFFYATPVAYWATWAICIANDQMVIGIFYAAIAAILAMFVASKLETGEWLWAIKTLFNMDE